MARTPGCCKFELGKRTGGSIGTSAKTHPDPEKKAIFEKRFAKHLDNDYVARQQCRQLILNDYENNPSGQQTRPRIETIKKWRAIL